MKLLVEEGVDYPVVEALRTADLDVSSVLEDAPGASDEAVLSRAVDEDRVLVTGDKDFGEMVYRRHLDVAGIVLVRLEGISPNEKASLVVEIVEQKGTVLEGRFTVVGPNRTRMRSMR